MDLMFFIFIPYLLVKQWPDSSIKNIGRSNTMNIPKNARNGGSGPKTSSLNMDILEFIYNPDIFTLP